MLKIKKKSELKKLKKGDLVDVIAPSSPATKAEIKKIGEFLSKKGLKMRFFDEDKIALPRKAADSFPICEKIRFAQLEKALKSKDSAAIWCVRGGYGSSDLIKFLVKHKKIAQNKLFIGFSDLTSLGGFLSQKWGWKIIYGVMLSQLSFQKVKKVSEKAIFSLIMGQKKILSYRVLAQNKVAKNIQKEIKGQLVGGCLSVFMQNFETKNEIKFKNQILLLEDIDESGERLDRRFEHLLQIFEHKNSYPKAILLGNFLQYIEDTASRKKVRKALDKFIAKIDERNLKIAVFEDKNAVLGHSDKIEPLIIGAEARIFGGEIKQKF